MYASGIVGGRLLGCRLENCVCFDGVPHRSPATIPRLTEQLVEGSGSVRDGYFEVVLRVHGAAPCDNGTVPLIRKPD